MVPKPPEGSAYKLFGAWVRAHTTDSLSFVALNARIAEQWRALTKQQKEDWGLQLQLKKEQYRRDQALQASQQVHEEGEPAQDL